MADRRTTQQVRDDLAAERAQLQQALSELRGTVRSRARSALPVAAAGAFVLAGGLGGIRRLLRRRSR